MNADRLTARSQEALSSAISRATGDGSPLAAPLHLLTALLEPRDGVASALVAATGASVDAVRARAESAVGRLPHATGASVAPPQLSRQLITVLDNAERQAARL